MITLASRRPEWGIFRLSGESNLHGFSLIWSVRASLAYLSLRLSNDLGQTPHLFYRSRDDAFEFLPELPLEAPPYGIIPELARGVPLSLESLPAAMDTFTGVIQGAHFTISRPSHAQPVPGMQ